MATLKFDLFQIDTADRKLFGSNGEVVPLTPRVFDLLLALAESDGRVLTKDELLETVWPDCIVEESNLSQTIFVLRKALGESANNPRCIRTVPYKGYRFIAPVEKETKNGFEQSAKSNSGAPETSGTGIRMGETSPASSGLLEDERHSYSKFLLWTIRVKALIAVLILATAIFATLLVGSHFQRMAAKPIDSIAVLPFVSRNGATNLDYLADGLTENITNKLSRVQSLKVLARSVVTKYKGKEIDPMKVGTELNVGAILIGDLLQEGEKVNIRLELIEATSGNLIWSESYQRSVNDFVGLQEEISRRTIENLSVRLTPNEQNQLSKRYTEHPDAYALYLRGRFFWKNGYSLESYQKAIDLYKQALALDPGFALAYAGIADCHNMMGENKLGVPKDEYPLARMAALKALEIDEGLAEAHLALAWTRFTFDWDWTGAEEEFQLSINLSPNHAQAHYWYSLFLRSVGRFDQAWIEIKRAQELDPLYLESGMGQMLYHARRYDEASEHFVKRLEREPDDINAHAWLFQIYAVKGLKNESLIELEKTAALLKAASPSSVEASFSKFEYGRGFDSVLREMVRLYHDESKRRYVSAYDFARAFALLKDNDNALLFLERAYEERSASLWTIGFEPLWDDLRPNPRFQNLMRRMNLERIRLLPPQ